MGFKASAFVAAGGNYIKADDVKAGPQKFEIKGIEAAETPDGKPALQLVMEGGKKLTLNKTNGRILQGHFGDDTDGWIAKKVVVSHDPDVMYAGRRVGGIRVRPVVAKVAAPAAATADDDFDL